jgi:hypothetical protein
MMYVHKSLGPHFNEATYFVIASVTAFGPDNNKNISLEHLTGMLATQGKSVTLH